MTKNEFKVGDKVMFKGNGESHVIIGINDEGLYRVSGSCGCFGAQYLEHYDRKTAFLTELQELLRKYDARIYDGDLYAIHIEIGYHDTKSEQADYLFYQSGNDEINADNIMDFDKE